jgi:transcriptional regulator with XRE-family HTH domain
MEKETFGEKIKRLREAKGLTKQELADKAGLTGANIRIIERGLMKTRVRADTIGKLAAALGVEYDELEEQ